MLGQALYLPLWAKIVRAMRTQWRRVPRTIGLGVLAGTVYGAFQVLGGDSLLSGVVTGLIFATFMAAGYYAGLGRFAHLSELTRGQRHTVARAVRLGRGLDDPALAEATIRHARWVQRAARPERWMTLIVWVLLGASGVALVAALLLGDAYVAFAGAFSLVVWTLILVVGPRVERRQVARAQRAEAAATERLGSVEPYS